MITVAEQITYRVKYIFEGFTLFTGGLDSLQEVCDDVVWMFDNYPSLVNAEVQCWRDGKYSHTMIRSYRRDDV